MEGRRRQNKSFWASTVVTFLIVVMLIFSGPAQAVMVVLNTGGINNAEVGETGYFYVNITIGANERIPIANISVDGLPEIPGSPGGRLIFNVSDIDNIGSVLARGNYHIKLIERSGWVGGYGYGYGYDSNYGYEPYYGYGYGYSFYGYGYGYGNGYGYGYGYGSDTSYTQLKYRIEVDTTGAADGTYHPVAKVNTGKGVVFVGSASFTLNRLTDKTPPASVTDLNSNSISWNSINWTWTNPEDVDFAKVMVYINGAFIDEVVSPGNHYNATGLRASTQYEIGTRTVDASGNINQTWVNHTARTAILPAAVKIVPQSLNLKKDEFKAFIELPLPYNVSDINESSVICEGARLEESEIENGTFIARFRTNDLVNITPGDMVSFTVTGNLNDGTPFTGSDTIKVLSRDETNDEETHRDSGSGDGGGGGGGGGASDEKYDNIELREKHDRNIYKDISTKYSFTETKNPVASIDIEGNINAGEITVSVEVLKETSTLVKKPAPGAVYKNLNIYVGNAGFSTPKNIKEAVIAFRADSFWLDSNGIAASEVMLLRWDGNDWEELKTKEMSKDSTYTWFEAYTNRFSPFAISGLKKELDQSMPAEQKVIGDSASSGTLSPEEVPGKENIGWLSGFLGVVAVFFLMVIAFLILYYSSGDNKVS